MMSLLIKCHILKWCSIIYYKNRDLTFAISRVQMIKCILHDQLFDSFLFHSQSSNHRINNWHLMKFTTGFKIRSAIFGGMQLLGRYFLRSIHTLSFNDLWIRFRYFVQSKINTKDPNRIRKRWLKALHNEQFLVLSKKFSDIWILRLCRQMVRNKLLQGIFRCLKLQILLI